MKKSLFFFFTVRLALYKLRESLILQTIFCEKATINLKDFYRTKIQSESQKLTKEHNAILFPKPKYGTSTFCDSSNLTVNTCQTAQYQIQIKIPVR